MKKIVLKNTKKVIKKQSSIETLAVLVVEGFERIDKRFESIDKRFESIDKRFESLETKVDSGFFSINHILQEHGERLNRIERKQTGILTNLDETVHRSEFKQLLSRVDSLEKKISRK